jgi:glycosyltransferase involved in cell wall biosynthesis
MPEADVTIATAWETVEPVLRFGSGRKAYFMQHFEPLFFAEPCYEKYLCELSYQMPLKRIANSQWLFKKISNYLNAHGISDAIYKCVNAVDLQTFRKIDREVTRDSKHVKVISYGGRGVAWKGFSDMAEAVAIARRRLPEHNIEWVVYGDAALPPDNATTPYVPLGFLNPQALCAAYNEADILLSASWYESFPLFPIEAMACGLAVITTRPGTEEYAHHGVTAHIVEPRNASSIADGLVRLVTDAAYRNDLSQNGEAISNEHTWSRSIDRMEAVLSEITSGSD